VLQPAQVDLCVDDPGYDVDLYVECEIAAMAAVWLGDLPLAQAVRARRVQLSGARELVRAFPDWLMLSRFAAVERPASRA
jgi:hypothetical protein